MALPSRGEFLSNLESDQCDICYDAMVEPAHTPCGHVYCLECLLTWLDENNTCPTCRTKLFEQDTDDESDDEMEADDEEDGDDELENTAGDTNRNAENEENANEYIERFANEITARVIELDTGMQRPAPHRIARTVTFDWSGLATLMATLEIERREWAELYDELNTRDVRYTFTVRVGVLQHEIETWKFDYISYPNLYEPDTAMSIVREEAVAQAMAHVQWARKISSYLYRIPASEIASAYQAQLRQGAVSEYRLIAYPREDNF
ncbi:hypothetical protein CB0940_03758 [Cercospora beticola]|uniref:RING-type domain-containing protein n=1 Tax=Cercospora beticola TaxID=122368 RepID=A0A2G5I1V6_CERBT|nr:hypothetical protein CB0940_03758 [Cercospora beticola]PIA98759.1 hypothetical protein CB0940_03758 [Cercospora beticola]WPB00953.1 hypothetical protein RHO25_005573 [Cercospora beticola]